MPVCARLMLWPNRGFPATANYAVYAIMPDMLEKMNNIFIALAMFAVAAGAACSNGSVEKPANANTQAAQIPQPGPTPSNQITEADIAKLKWLEGTWRGMDGEKPFYERIHFEGTTMVVETLTDETLSKVGDTARFELKDGEFGNTVGESRSAASSIGENSVQFVPDAAQPGGTPKGHTFRFERQDDGTWLAILETQATPTRPASQKTYKMEPWKASAK